MSLNLPDVPAAKIKSLKPSVFRADVQGLRAIAVLAVIADHLLGYPAGGFVGVDIFFVISGFLITGLLLREQEKNGRISFADFYRRRIRRIMPVAVIVLAATVAASWALFAKVRAQDISWDGFWALIFGANWHLAAVGTDYMNAEGPVSPLQHYWSLAVEEQFYFIWPWIIVLVLGVVAGRFSMQPQQARRLLTAVFAVVIVATFAFAVWETAVNPTVAYFSTISRAWELAIGALLAVVGSRFANLSLRVRTVLGYVGLAGIAWSLFFITPTMAFPGPWAVVPVLSTALVIAAGTGGEQRYLYPLTNPVSGYIGNISYSLYLWHFPVIILMGALIPQEDTVAWAAMVLGMFALSIASYHFIEDPIRKSSWLEPSRKNKRRDKGGIWDQKSVPAGMGVLVLITAMVVMLAVTKPLAADEASAFQPAPLALNGAAAPTQPAAEPTTAAGKLAVELAAASTAMTWPELSPSVDELKLVPEWIEDRCLDTNESNFTRCAYGDPAADKTAVVLGDSVSISWMPGLRESLGKEGWRIQLLTMTQCPAVEIPVTKSDNAEGFTEDCLEHQQWAQEKVAQLNPDMVIVSSSLSAPGRVVGAGETPDVLDAWTEATAKTLQELKGSTSGDVVLLSVAMRGANLLNCATKVSRPADCKRTAEGDGFLGAVAAEEAAAAQVEGVRFVSTVPWFCTPNAQCPAFAGNTPIYAEGGHITPEYSAKLAPLLGPALLGEPAE